MMIVSEFMLLKETYRVGTLSTAQFKAELTQVNVGICSQGAARAL